MNLHTDGMTYYRNWDTHTHLRSPAQIGQKGFERLLHMNTSPYAVVIAEPNAALDAEKPQHHIFTAEDVLRYQEIVEAARERENKCRIFYLIKLTDTTNPNDLDKALALPFVLGVKIYPDGVTTGANHGGLTDFWGPRLQENFAVVAARRKIVQEHPERPGVTSSKREFEYRGILECHVAQNPNVRFFAEHMSDRHTLPLIERYPNLFGTITGHHLRLTEDDVLGVADCFCRPHAKSPEDRDALVQAALGKRPGCVGKIISITDSALHFRCKKHEIHLSADRVFEGCAGILNPGEVAIPDVASLFEEHDALGELEEYTSLNASRAYEIPHDPNDNITLDREKWRVAKSYDLDGNDDHRGVPFKATQWMGLRIAV